jgi:hypothetical protein
MDGEQVKRSRDDAVFDGDGKELFTVVAVHSLLR